MSLLKLRQIRRWALRGTALVAAGAVTNVALACGIILWSGQPDVKFGEGGEASSYGKRTHRWTSRNEESIGRARIERATYCTEYIRTGWCGVRDPRELLISTETTLTAGFPFKAFEASWTVSAFPRNELIESRGSIAQTPAAPFLLQAPKREFPVSPSWPGFAANSGLFAVALGLVWRLTFVSKTRGRAGTSRKELRA